MTSSDLKKKTTSVADPSHFDMDPDLGIHIWEKWNWIRIHLYRIVDPDPVPPLEIAYPDPDIFYPEEIHVGQMTILIITA